ncbi:MAG: hypothetical protein QXP01_07490 [Candidatus Hadarchaeum sp.]
MPTTPPSAFGKIIPCAQSACPSCLTVSGTKILLSFIIGSCFTQVLALCSAGDIPAADFLRDYATAAERLHQFYSHLSGKAQYTSKFMHFGKEISWELDFRLNGELQRWTTYCVHDTLRPPGHIGSKHEFVAAPRLCFLVKLNPASHQYSLELLGKNQYDVKYTCMSYLALIQSPFHIYEIPLSSILQHPDVRFHADPDPLGGTDAPPDHRIVRVTIDLVAKDKPLVPVTEGIAYYQVKGNVVLNSNYSYSITSYDILLEGVILHNQSSAQRKVTARITYDYPRRDKVPLLKKVEINAKLGSQGHMVDVMDVSRLVHQEVPPEEFQLSAFGIMLPGYVEEKPSRLWLWFLGLGFLLLLVGVVIVRLRRSFGS